MVDVKYLLIEANRVKIGEYSRVSMKFISEAIGYLYSGDTKAQKYLYKRFSSLSKGSDGIDFSVLLSYFPYTQNYLCSYDSNSTLRFICVKAVSDPVYEELLFILLICGLVNSKDVLGHYIDVNIIMSRIGIKNKCNSRKNPKVLSSLLVTPRFYCVLMRIFIENCSMGVDYGFDVYDFVYHVYSACGKDYSKTMVELNKLELSGYGCFSVNSTKRLSKYKDEIALMLPIIMGNTSISIGIVVRIIALLKSPLREYVLANNALSVKMYSFCTVEERR